MVENTCRLSNSKAYPDKYILRALLFLTMIEYHRAQIWSDGLTLLRLTVEIYVTAIPQVVELIRWKREFE